MKLLRAVEGTRRTEQWFHRRFASLRVRGEWFTFDPQMLRVSPLFHQDIPLTDLPEPISDLHLYLRVELFDRLRTLAMEDTRSVSNMASLLIERALQGSAG